jgi:hypothetical protein
VQVEDKLAEAVGPERTAGLADLVLGRVPWSVETLLASLAGARWETL